MSLNNFSEDLLFSEQSSDEDFWAEIYKQAFPDMAFHVLNTAGKSQSQNLGIDRIIHLKSGRTLYIDEKKRRTTYGDILLEYKSNGNEKENNGWINKHLHIDYIAYAFMDTKTVYLLDWQMLRKVWLENGIDWSKRCKKVAAKNNTYTTYSLAIPTEELMEKMGKSVIVKASA